MWPVSDGFEPEKRAHTHATGTRVGAPSHGLRIAPLNFCHWTTPNLGPALNLKKTRDCWTAAWFSPGAGGTCVFFTNLPTTT